MSQDKDRGQIALKFVAAVHDGDAETMTTNSLPPVQGGNSA
jgi:hypothetical protein